jgi:hypothetical protein
VREREREREKEIKGGEKERKNAAKLTISKI